MLCRRPGPGRGSYACAALIPGEGGARGRSRNGPPPSSREGDGCCWPPTSWPCSRTRPRSSPEEGAWLGGRRLHHPRCERRGRGARARCGLAARDSSKGQWPPHAQGDPRAARSPGPWARGSDRSRNGRRGAGGLHGRTVGFRRRVQVLACGTALHAGMVAAYAIEQLARVPVDGDFASSAIASRWCKAARSASRSPSS